MGKLIKEIIISIETKVILTHDVKDEKKTDEQAECWEDERQQMLDDYD